MKTCVLNLSGNVGKSTLAVHLLGAFVPDARIISVESINASDATDIEALDVEELNASRFREIFRELMVNDDVIVDVGASNVGAFMAEMERFRSSVGEFDHVLIPTVPADKQQRDTVATIDWLAKLGVDPSKVRVIYNQYPSQALEPVEIAYAVVAGYAATDGKGKAVYEPYAVISANEVFELAKSSRKTIAALAQDSTDWRTVRAEAKRAGDWPALEQAMTGQMTHDLAVSAQHNLAEVHALLFPQLPATAPVTAAATKTRRA